jgi:hypothetical protein
MPRSDRFILEKKTRYPPFTGGWVGVRSSLDSSRKSRPLGIRSPDRQAGSESHTATELSQPKGHVQNHYEHTQRNH